MRLDWDECRARETDFAAQVARLLRFVGGERRHHHLGFAGVGPADRLAVVSEGFLGEALGVAASAGAFRIVSQR